MAASEVNLRYRGKSITAHTARASLVGLAIPMQDKIRTLSEWLHGNPDELRFGARRGLCWPWIPAPLESVDLQDRLMLAQYLALPAGHRKTVQKWRPWRLPPRMRNWPSRQQARSINRRSDRKRRSSAGRRSCASAGAAPRFRR